MGRRIKDMKVSQHMTLDFPFYDCDPEDNFYLALSPDCCLRLTKHDGTAISNEDCRLLDKLVGDGN